MLQKSFRFILVLIFFYSSNLLSQGSWIEQSSGTGRYLNDVHFVNSSTGWCTGENGIILKTTNGGGVWTNQQSNTTEYFRSVFFINSNLGWIVGDNGTILKTTNGGISWVSKESGVTKVLEDVFFIDENIGWAVGWDLTILKTTDGGESWNIKNSGTYKSFCKVQFITSNLGWASGSTGTLYKTTNGGESWTNISLSDKGKISTFFIDDKIGWAGEDQGNIYKTINGGASWTHKFYEHGGKEELYFVNPLKGWCVGATIHYTENGGETWTEQDRGWYSTLNAVHFPNSYTGWSVGRNGKIVKYSGAPPTIIVSSPNGNENWAIGTKKDISWSYSDLTSICIQYSADNGTTWHDIATKIDASPMLYEWTIPDAASNNCIVKVFDYYDAGIFDISDATFKITSPHLELVTPDGNEKWRVGSRQKIEWHYENINDIQILYSLNNGNTWKNVIDKISANERSYSWTIPNEPSENCRIKIADYENATICDSSDAQFSIVLPQIELINPNGGESFEIDSQENITWISSNISEVNISYSINGGVTWDTIGTKINSTGFYIWNIPDTPTLQCIIKISDFSDNSIFDMSDSSFSIIPATDISIENNLLGGYDMAQNYPNPFNPETTIKFVLPKTNKIELKVYDAKGTIVRKLFSGFFPAGNHSFKWDGKNNKSENVSSGLYFYSLKAGEFKSVKKMMLIR